MEFIKTHQPSHNIAHFVSSENVSSYYFLTELFTFAICYSYIYLNEDIFLGKSPQPKQNSDFCKQLEYISPHDVYTVRRTIFTINLLESFMCANVENGKILYMFILFKVTIYFMGYLLYSSSYEHDSIFQSWYEKCIK